MERYNGFSEENLREIAKKKVIFRYSVRLHISIFIIFYKYVVDAFIFLDNLSSLWLVNRCSRTYNSVSDLCKRSLSKPKKGFDISFNIIYLCESIFIHYLLSEYGIFPLSMGLISISVLGCGVIDSCRCLYDIF